MKEELSYRYFCWIVAFLILCFTYYNNFFTLSPSLSPPSYSSGNYSLSLSLYHSVYLPLFSSLSLILSFLLCRPPSTHQLFSICLSVSKLKTTPDPMWKIRKRKKNKKNTKINRKIVYTSGCYTFIRIICNINEDLRNMSITLHALFSFPNLVQQTLSTWTSAVHKTVHVHTHA